MSDDDELTRFEVDLLLALSRKGKLATIPALGYCMPPNSGRYKEMRSALEELVDRRLAIRGRLRGNTAFKLSSRGEEVLEAWFR